MRGKTLRVTIGSVIDWDIGDAREEGRRIARLIDKGIDPRVEQKERDLEERRRDLLVSDVWDAYLAARKPVWGERHFKDHEWLVRPELSGRHAGVLLPLLKKRMRDIDAEALVKWAQDAKETLSPKFGSPKTNLGRATELRQGYVRARALFNWAASKPEYSGLVDPAIFKYPDLDVLIPDKRAKSDLLQVSQLEAWFREVRKLSNPVIAAYLQCLLISGARRNEIGTLKWENVDFVNKTLTIRDKIAEERTLPLTPYLESLISPLKRKNQWVFSSTFKNSPTGRLVEPRIGHRRALKAAGLPSVSLHGLRRTFITHSEKIGMPVGVCDNIVGHAAKTTHERHYAWRDLDTLRIWLENYEDWFIEKGGVPFNKEEDRPAGLRAVE